MIHNLRSIAIFTLFILLIEGCNNSQEKVSVGTIERDRILLTAVEDEIVTNIAVKVGQQVEKGQLLVQLKNTSALAKLHEAQANLELTTANLAKLIKGPRQETIIAMKANLAQSEADLSLKTISFERSKKLQLSDAQSKAAYDASLAQMQIATANRNAIQAKLQELINGTRPEDIAQAKAQVRVAKANVDLIKQRLSDLSIKATRAGIVEALPWHMGERVSLGSPVAVLLSNSIPFARVYVPEKIRAQVAIGQNAQVFVDGYKKAFKAKVSRIANNPSFTPYYTLTDTDRQRLVYLAEVTLLENANKLPSGLPVRVYFND